MSAWRPAAFMLVLFAAGSAMAAPVRYQSGNGTCDGWPRAPIGMAEGMCAGFVIKPPEPFSSRTLKLPRMILPLAGGKDFLVTDLGGWIDKRGTVFRLHAENGKTELTPLLRRLTMPHGLMRGPDGKIYVGEMSRIFRFDPDARDPSASIEPIVTGLPDNKLHENRHPLSYFIFDRDGALLVNVGALTDQCATDAKAGAAKCSETGSAQIRRYAYLGNGKWSRDYTIFAQGLRNSMALALHPSGTILQAENSIDFSDPNSPFEELNVLKSGANYGWPYCYDMDKPVPVWADAKIDCKSAAYEKPIRLLPPHIAPLAMLYYNGPMFPQLRGKLLMTWHGYRLTGGRIAAFDVDAKGIPLLAPKARYVQYSGDDKLINKAYPGPASEAFILTPQWNRRDGLRPMGVPVSLAVADDGAIWVTEDKNATILRIARDRP